MGFSAKQVKALRRNLDHRYVRTREANGRELSYIEGWYAISEANRIFGFDGWNRETTESRCVLARENRGSFLAVYTARVRITVQADGVTFSEKVTVRVKAAALHPVRRMTPLSRAQKPMPRNAPWPHSESHSGWRSMGAPSHRRSGKTECCPLRLQAGCALAFIPMTRPLFQDRRDITAVANTLH